MSMEEIAILGFLVTGLTGGVLLFALVMWGDRLHRKAQPTQDRPQRRHR
jgi:hypothetical protein